MIDVSVISLQRAKPNKLQAASRRGSVSLRLESNLFCFQDGIQLCKIFLAVCLLLSLDFVYW